MCGIAGFANFAEDGDSGPGPLEAMIEVLRHRGPDGSGAHTARGGRVHLAHTLLSIVGHGTNAQPFTLEETASGIMLVTSEVPS